MNANQHHISSKRIGSTMTMWPVWAGLSLILIAALAITVATQLAPAPSAAQPVIRVQTVPDAAAQGVANYLRAHEYASRITGQVVPDAASQGVAGYVGAHALPSAQLVPDAAAQGVNNYLRAHSSNVLAQAVPDAATQGVLGYLGAHATAAQSVPDAATQGILNYLRAHGANVK